jgi:hypothetical protein
MRDGEPRCEPSTALADGLRVDVRRVGGAERMGGVCDIRMMATVLEMIAVGRRTSIGRSKRSEAEQRAANWKSRHLQNDWRLPLVQRAGSVVGIFSWIDSLEPGIRVNTTPVKHGACRGQRRRQSVCCVCWRVQVQGEPSSSETGG